MNINKHYYTHDEIESIATLSGAHMADLYRKCQLNDVIYITIACDNDAAGGSNQGLASNTDIYGVMQILETMLENMKRDYPNPPADSKPDTIVCDFPSTPTEKTS